VLSPRRNARLPNVPTLAEAGIRGADVVSFGGLSVPKGTPAPVVDNIRGALTAALAEPEVRAQLEGTGVTVTSCTSEAFAQALSSEIATTERLMKTAKIEPQ
jgi:tripartite-type tricarboxylate transporter receptor subunit TctC